MKKILVGFILIIIVIPVSILTMNWFDNDEKYDDGKDVNKAEENIVDIVEEPHDISENNPQDDTLGDDSGKDDNMIGKETESDNRKPAKEEVIKDTANTAKNRSNTSDNVKINDDNKDTVVKKDSEQSQANTSSNTNNVNTTDTANASAGNTDANTKENNDIAISDDKIQNVENSLSLEDKAKVVKLIISRLTVSDIKLLKDLVVGGLTQEEKEKALKIAYTKYSEEELKLVKELYSKYMGN